MSASPAPSSAALLAHARPAPDDGTRPAESGDPARPTPATGPGSADLRLLRAADVAADPQLFGEFLDHVQAIEEEVLMESIGLPELVTTAAERRAGWESDPHHRRDLALAVGGDACLGCAVVVAPLRDNLDSADVAVDVLPGLAPETAAAVDDLLWAHVDAVVSEVGRTVLYADEQHPDHPDANYSAAALGRPAAHFDGARPEVGSDSGTARPDPGAARLDLGRGPGGTRPLRRLAPGHGALFADDPAVLRLESRGFRLVQIERFAVLPVGDVPAPEVPAGLRAHSWVGDVPAHLLDALAHLLTVFEATIPVGEADFEPVVHTPERVRDEDRLTRARGITAFGTVLLRADDGAPLGVTVFRVGEGREFGFQESTVTVPEARGRGYAVLLKRLNAGHLRASAPEVERVYTWNAAENAPMLAINDRVGFRTLGMTGIWQRGGR